MPRISPILVRALTLVAASSLAARLCAQPATAPEPFAAGDRWCAVGDSITHSGPYHGLVWLYYVTRFPERVIEPSNAGLSADTAAGGLRRLEWDILPHRPTVASVMFGMNDVGRMLYNDPATPELEEKRRERLSSYKESQRLLVKALQERGARVILITPSLFDQTVEVDRPKQTGVNEALAECASFLKTLAAETGATVVDFHEPMTRLNAEVQRADAKLTIVGPDRVHPGPPGHLLMAYLFLRAQRVPSDVARLTIDAKKKRVTAAVNGEASDVRRRGKGELSFTWTEKALPFPISTAAAPALEWMPDIQELSQEILQVTGLAAGHYALSIDDETPPLGPYSADALASGVNLGTARTTPQYRQALAVAEKVEKRRALLTEKVRNLALIEHRLVPNGPHPVTMDVMKPLLAEQFELFKTKPPAPSIQRATEAYPELKPKEAESIAAAAQLLDEARHAARPRPHRYRLKPVD
jgi:lysophospholipase L1-like esterase